MKVFNVVGETLEIKKCLGCEIANEEIKIFGGMIYKDKYFNISQDFELPIKGFLIIASNRHVEKFTDLTLEERNDLIVLLDKTLKSLKDGSVAEEYNIVVEEKKGYHFHVWLMPRHEWMKENFGNVLKNLKKIQDYALKNLRTKENFEEIKNICEKVRKDLN